MNTAASGIDRGLLRRPLARVCASVWQARRSKGLIWLSLLVLSFLLGLIPMDVLPPGTSAKVVRGIATVGLSTMALIVWMVFAFNVLQQNQPEWARLVPAHVAALRRALYLGTALVAACIGALGSWAGWSGPGTVLIVAPLCAAIACALRWPVLWLLLAVVLAALPVWLKAGVVAWDEVPLALAATMFACTGLALRAVVFTGGAGHARSQLQLAAVATRMRGAALTAPQRSLDAGWFGPTRWGDWIYTAWMRRLLAHPHGPVRARLALGMGPQAHWSGVFANALYLLLLFLLLAAACVLFPQWKALQAMQGGLLIGLAMIGLMVPLQLPPALWATRREQALLTLLPGTPRGAALNRWLAARLAALDVAVMLALILLVAVFGQLGGSSLASSRIGDDVVLGALVLGLPLTFALWRDWARARAPSGLLQWGWIASIGVIGGLAAAWAHGLERPWYELVAWTALLALPLGVWRWRHLQRLPAAWPVGRMEAQTDTRPGRA